MKVVVTKTSKDMVSFTQLPTVSLAERKVCSSSAKMKSGGITLNKLARTGFRRNWTKEEQDPRTSSMTVRQSIPTPLNKYSYVDA
jgi:hypothetical protein